MCILFRAPALKLTTARLKLLLISGVSSVCRVTGPPVNKGLFAGSAGIASGLSTFIRTSSFQSLVLHALSPLTLRFQVKAGGCHEKIWDRRGHYSIPLILPCSEFGL